MNSKSSSEIKEPQGSAIGPGGAPSPVERERRRHSLLLLASLTVVAVVIVAAAYRPALPAKALSLDDPVYFSDNALVQQPGRASAARFFREILIPSTARGYYRPLETTSIMLDRAMGGRIDNLRPFHRTSLALHVANTILIILLLYLLFQQPVVAVMLGLLFGLHPIAVETVASVGERKTVLAAFFTLICLVLYVAYAQKNSRACYAGSFAASIPAVLSWPASATIPLLLLLLDVWPLNRVGFRKEERSRLKGVLIEKLPFFVISCAAAAVAIVFQVRTASVVTPDRHPAVLFPLTLVHNIIFYLYHLVWPVHLNFHYPFPDPMNLSQPMLLAGLIGTIILVPLLVLSFRWSRAPLIGWLFFMVALFPVLGLVGFAIVIAADKFAYLPSVGLLLVAAALLAWVWQRRPGGTARHALRAGLVLLVVFLAGSEFRLTRRTIHPWQDTETLYRTMLQRAPDSNAVRYNLAAHLIQQGKTDEAVPYLNQVIEKDPYHWMALNELGEIYRRKRQTDMAIERFEAAIEIKPDFVAAINNLGLAYYDQGKFQEAIARFDEAIRIKPDHRSAYINKGSALCQMHRYQEALVEFDAALRITPDHALTFFNKGLALRNLGRTNEAIQAFREALRLRPGYESAGKELDAALKETQPETKTP
jgi:tetratricopeptide (TPR) repeat protein